ncbi:MAG: DNA topoisomerase IV subunit B [Rickettsiales bacterium]|nr:DNA topoisomerase IV subunit B [Rickettsiales bacterium]|tara:strand:- start:2487 stop:4463 length:1977 start_codon:yes stop_codon:yes gene_type:complete
MSELFKRPVQQKQQAYTAEDIQVLEGLEPVRHRPGMYIGGTDLRAYHHLASEILDNAMDEAVAGHATTIYVHLAANNFLTIKDNGRGIPFDPHPKNPSQSALEVILTTLHAGGKFKEGAYQTAGGLHGVGLSVVNALSDFLKVTVVRDQKVVMQEFSKGIPTTVLTPLTDKRPFQRGTEIIFQPDATIFEEGCQFKPEKILKLLHTKAFLYKGVKLYWSCDPDLVANTATPSQEEIYYPNGLLDYLSDQLKNQDCVLENSFAGRVAFANDEGSIEWALNWCPDKDDSFTSFCNTIPTPLGGAHESGFKSVFGKSLRAFGEMVKNKKAAKLTTDDIFSHAQVLLSIFIKDPQFQGQTKEKLASAKATRLIEASLRDYLDHWFAKNVSQSQKILDISIANQEERKRLKALKETDRKSATQRLRLPGKLVDCSSRESKGSEIFLVEGNSAGGTAKRARERQFQAILPLRGKILNVVSATLDKMLANQEIKDMLQALGCGIGPTFDINALRYERIIIMTDADVDGAHIAALLMSFFYEKMPQIVENGHLYLARPPLYRLTSGTTSVYATDEEERETLLNTTFKNKKVDILRFKGLGEMDDDQLKDTMNPKTRILEQLTLQEDPTEPDQISIKTFVQNLMGRNPEKRFEFIETNASFVEDLDI